MKAGELAVSQNDCCCNVASPAMPERILDTVSEQISACGSNPNSASLDKILH